MFTLYSPIIHLLHTSIKSWSGMCPSSSTAQRSAASSRAVNRSTSLLASPTNADMKLNEGRRRGPCFMMHSKGGGGRPAGVGETLGRRQKRVTAGSKGSQLWQHEKQNDLEFRVAEGPPLHILHCAANYPSNVSDSPLCSFSPPHLWSYPPQRS